jgi:hypothetical protein
MCCLMDKWFPICLKITHSEQSSISAYRYSVLDGRVRHAPYYWPCNKHSADLMTESTHNTNKKLKPLVILCCAVICAIILSIYMQIDQNELEYKKVWFFFNSSIKNEKYLPEPTIISDFRKSYQKFLLSTIQLAESHPNISFQVIQIGKSAESRPIHLFSFSREKTNKKALFVFGMHPREMISVELAMFVVNRFMRSSNESKIQSVLDSMSLDIIGMLNPDGFAHMEQKKDPCWRWNAERRGVDLNRNTDWNWGGPGSSDTPLSEEFRGDYPFSERESKSLRELMTENSYTRKNFVLACVL